MKRLIAAAMLATLALGAPALAQQDRGRDRDRGGWSDDGDRGDRGDRGRGDRGGRDRGDRDRGDRDRGDRDRGDRDRGDRGDRDWSGGDRNFNDNRGSWDRNDRRRDWSNNDRGRNRDWNRNDTRRDWNRNDNRRSWSNNDRSRRDRHDWNWRSTPRYGDYAWHGDHRYRARPIWRSHGVPYAYRSHFHWGVGSYYPYDYRRYVIVDYYDYYLPPPPHHHVWVRHDDGAYLVALATGLIVGLALSDSYYY